MNRDDKLKLDYEETTRYHHQLADSRFKLLALVPVVTGAAIFLAGGITKPDQVLMIGILGFVVTLGIVFYNQRNTQVFDTMIVRAKMLETLFEFEPLDDRYRFGGPFLSRPERTLKLFGIIKVWGDRGLAIVYGATLGGWAFLITSAVLTYIVLARPTSLIINIGIPIIIAIAFIWQLHKWDKETEAFEELPSRIQQMIQDDMKKEED